MEFITCTFEAVVKLQMKQNDAASHAPELGDGC